MLRTVTKFPDLLCSCFTRFSGHCFWRSHEVLHSQINIKFNNHHLFIFCAFLNSSKGPSQGTSFYWALLYWASRILHLCVCVCVCVCVYVCVFTNWRFVATVHWASLSAPFFQLYLLTSCHILIILAIFQSSASKKISTCWSLRCWLAFFSNKLFLVKVCALFFST